MEKYKIELNECEIVKHGINAITDFYNTIALENLTLHPIHAYYTGINSPFLNVVIDTGLSKTDAPLVIKKVAEFFDKYHFPWGWFVTSKASIPIIENEGFTLIDESPGMYFDLTNSLPKTSNNLTIKQLCRNDDLHEWIAAIREGFPSDDNCEAYRKLNADLLNSGDTKLCHYVAYENKDIAAAATLFLSDNSVMLHNLATRTQYRNRGIGTALTLHIMNEAKKLGFQHCFLDSSEEGLTLYRRLGFKVYCVTLVYEKLLE